MSEQRIQELEAQCAAMLRVMPWLIAKARTADGHDSLSGPAVDCAQCGAIREAEAALATDAGKAMLESHAKEIKRLRGELGTQDAEILILRCRAEKVERVVRLISEPCPHCGGTVGPGPGEPKPSLMCYGCAPLEAERPRHGTAYGDYEEHLKHRAEKAERERDELAEALARDDNWNDKDEAYIAGRTQALAEMRERCVRELRDMVDPFDKGLILQSDAIARLEDLPLEPKDGEG